MYSAIPLASWLHRDVGVSVDKAVMMYFYIASLYSLAERIQCKPGKFEVLYSERYTHYGDEKQQSEAYMCKRDGYASDKPPDYVEYGVQASVGRRRRQYFGAKRHESHCRKFKCLQPERYADYGTHHRHTWYYILYGYGEAAEYDPDDI